MTASVQSENDFRSDIKFQLEMVAATQWHLIHRLVDPVRNSSRRTIFIRSLKTLTIRCLSERDPGGDAMSHPVLRVAPQFGVEAGLEPSPSRRLQKIRRLQLDVDS
jgi:hypothetical protein